MRLLDPKGFSLREPAAKKKHRGVLVSLGPHHEWSADGHDKLAQIGFPIWGVRDKWSGKWLGLWVVPNNRRLKATAYLYLKLVAELGGKSCQGHFVSYLWHSTFRYAHSIINWLWFRNDFDIWACMCTEVNSFIVFLILSHVMIDRLCCILETILHRNWLWLAIRRPMFSWRPFITSQLNVDGFAWEYLGAITWNFFGKLAPGFIILLFPSNSSSLIFPVPIMLADLLPVILFNGFGPS